MRTEDNLKREPPGGTPGRPLTGTILQNEANLEPKPLSFRGRRSPREGNCKTKPIWRAKHRAGCLVDLGPGPFCKTKPILSRNHYPSAGEEARGRETAKRSQFGWPSPQAERLIDLGPGRLCKTKPNSSRSQDPPAGEEVRGRKLRNEANLAGEAPAGTPGRPSTGTILQNEANLEPKPLSSRGRRCPREENRETKPIRSSASRKSDSALEPHGTSG